MNIKTIESFDSDEKKELYIKQNWDGEQEGFFTVLIWNNATELHEEINISIKDIGKITTALNKFR
tara:strand:+ start:845 stop:1039 length:195 start_codon:yes stop_codon:yes gene_type:complete